MVELDDFGIIKISGSDPCHMNHHYSAESEIRSHYRADSIGLYKLFNLFNIGGGKAGGANHQVDLSFSGQTNGRHRGFGHGKIYHYIRFLTDKDTIKVSG